MMVVCNVNINRAFKLAIMKTFVTNKYTILSYSYAYTFLQLALFPVCKANEARL